MYQSRQLSEKSLQTELMRNNSMMSLATNASSVDFLNKTNKVNLLETKVYQNFKSYASFLYLTPIFDILCFYEFTGPWPNQLRLALRIASSVLMILACANGAYAKLKFKPKQQLFVIVMLALTILTTIAYIYVFIQTKGISEVRKAPALQSIIGIIYMPVQLICGIYLFPDAIKLRSVLKKRSHLVMNLNVRRTESFSRSAFVLNFDENFEKNI